MDEILINYEQVYSRAAALRGHICNDLLPRIESEYTQIRSKLDSVDGATNSNLKESMQANELKSVIMLNGLERLLTFMENSSREFEQNEKEMADEVASGIDTESGER
jgi:hypothetical protein